MYKLIIADDEPLARTGIQSLLDWASLGVEVVGTARNGCQAMELIESHMPDIVITDIKMPVQDGLSLARECGERYAYPPVFIFLTGYDDFQFVRSALQTRAADYLIKTEADEKALEAAVCKAIESLRRDGAARRREAFFMSLLNNLFDTAEAYGVQKAAACVADTPFYLAADCTFGAATGAAAWSAPDVIRVTLDALSRFAPCYAVAQDVRRFAVICCLQDRDNYRRPLSDAFAAARTALQTSCGMSLDVSVGGLAPSLQRLSVSCAQARSLCPVKDATVFHGQEKAAPGSHAGQQERVANDIKRYVAQNYRRPLTLIEVASALNFNPSYLSHLFSQQTGVSLMDYIASLRVAEAKRLLLMGESSVAEIAAQVGFESPFYFSRVFKRVAGVSPRIFIKSAIKKISETPLEP